MVAKNHASAWRVIRERAENVGSDLVGACATVPSLRSTEEFGADLRNEFELGRWRQPGWMGSNEVLITPPDPGLTDVTIRSPLLGAHQVDNARAAAATLNVLYQLGHAFDVNAAIRGIGDAEWPCRCEVLELDGWPPVILDGAHNDASLRALRDTLQPFCFKSDSPNLEYILILGITEGHEFEIMARELATSAIHAISTQSRHPKSSPASRLAEEGRKNGLEFSVQLSVDEALKEARRIADENPEIGLIVVTGSLFVAAEAREHLLGIEPEVYDDLKQPYMLTYETPGTAESKIA